MKKGYIEIINGLLQGHKYGFIQSATLGRGKGNTLRLVDPKVSRIHAKIYATKEGFHIKDLKSSNGTFVNGNKIESHILRSGDKIRIGLTELLFSEKEILRVEEGSPGAKIATEISPIDLSRGEPDELALSRVGLQELMNRFQAILRVNRTIGSEVDLHKAFEKLLEEIFLLLPADRGAILSVNEESGRLEIVCSRTRKGPVEVKDILVSRTILNKVMEESVGLLIDDATSDERFELSDSISSEDIRSAMCVPLIQKSEMIGIIYLDVLGLENVFKKDDLDLLMAIAGPASVQVQNALYVDQLNNTYWDTIRALSNAIEARDRYTIGHNWRVCRLAMIMVSNLGWSEEDTRIVEQGGILHDIGKIGVSDTILLKDENFNEEEWKSMKGHPEIGAQMIKGIDFLSPVLPFVLYHHERWDGSGYPFGLKRTDIPVEGRLLAVCDAFDAMTTKRPYRNAMKPEVALKEVRKNKEVQFDPKMVDAFVLAWRSGNMAHIMNEYVER